MDFNMCVPGFVFASGYVIRNENSDSFDNYATPSGRSFANWPSNSFPCQTCNATSLIGKVGKNGKPFLTGERSYINQTGRLYLRINDNPLWDNKGAFVAVIYKHVYQIGSNNLVNYSRKADQKSNDFQKSENVDVNNNDNDFQFDETLFELYPNPESKETTVELINVNPKTTVGTLNIFDTSGKIIWSKPYKSNSKKMRIPLKGFEKGMYVVILNINGENKSKKLIVN